jgi:hypothetical protein
MLSVLVSRWATPVVLAIAIGLAAVGAAGAVDVLPLPPHPNPGVFNRAGAPVYAENPDGWACHYLGITEHLVAQRCTAPEQRAAQHPPAAWRSGRLGEPVDDVSCRRGWFVLIQTARGRGWVASSDISTNAVRRDGHNRVAGCDAFTWS